MLKIFVNLTCINGTPDLTTGVAYHEVGNLVVLYKVYISLWKQKQLAALRQKY
jgi:hypothetical protein